MAITSIAPKKLIPFQRLLDVRLVFHVAIKLTMSLILTSIGAGLDDT